MSLTLEVKAQTSKSSAIVHSLLRTTASGFWIFWSCQQYIQQETCSAIPVHVLPPAPPRHIQPGIRCILYLLKCSVYFFRGSLCLLRCSLYLIWRSLFIIQRSLNRRPGKWRQWINLRSCRLQPGSAVWLLWLFWGRGIGKRFGRLRRSRQWRRQPRRLWLGQR